MEHRPGLPTEKGRLRIFLGIGPGSGKTRALLESALDRIRAGGSVLPCLIDTHDDPELLELLAKLPSGSSLSLRGPEALLEAAPSVRALGAALGPGSAAAPSLPKGTDGAADGEAEGPMNGRAGGLLVLVDDAAIPNPRRAVRGARWMEVLELVDRGFEVWTTLDVQDLEDCAYVAGSSRRPSRVPVPGRFIGRADEIIPVQVEAHDIIRRSQDSRSRGSLPWAVPDSIRELGALRELALKVAARYAALGAAPGTAPGAARADWAPGSAAPHGAAPGRAALPGVGPGSAEDRNAAQAGRPPSEAGPGRPARPRSEQDATHGLSGDVSFSLGRARPASRIGILVAVGPSPSSARLIRWTSRRAEALEESWAAIHVDTGRVPKAEEAERLESNLALARRLGAETLVLPGHDVAETVLEAARMREAELVVIGRSGLSPLGLMPRRATVSDRIVRAAGAVDVAVIQDGEGPRRRMELKALARRFTVPWRQYVLLVAAFGATTILGLLLFPFLEYRGIALLYLAAVLGLSFLAEPGPVAALAVLSALALNFFFIPPVYTFTIGSASDFILFALYFLVASVTGSLVSRLRSDERILEEREARSAFLFGSAQRLAEKRRAEEAAGEAARLVEEHFGTPAVVLMADGQGGLQAEAWGGAAGLVGEGERRAALVSLKEGVAAGLSTERGAGSRLHWVPASAGGECSAVIGLAPLPGSLLTRADDNLLLSLGRTLALAVDRAVSESRGRALAVELESERLATVLLDSVSHELRTPLTTITGSLSALRDEELAGNPEARRIMLEGALEAAVLLDRVVGEILTMSRMEAGSLRPRRESVELGELAELAARLAKGDMRNRELASRVPEDAGPAFIDLGLAARLAANLLRNAAAYSRPEGPVELELRAEGKDLVLAVQDPGPGIPPEELSAMFDRFKRGRKVRGGGLGLGLAIARGIAQVHGGELSASRLADGRFEICARFPEALEAAR